MSLPPADPDVAAVEKIGGVPTILKVITETTGLRLAMVARITADDWKACAVHDALEFGMRAGDHLAIATTLCKGVREARMPIVIEHASADSAYCDHPAPKMYAFESYVGVPIFLANGDYFGNVCALDRQPLPLRERRAEEILTLFAQLIGLQLDAEAAATSREAALLDARSTAELREQFIAVLGHDLRNPLSAILTGADMLLERGLAAAEHRIVERVRNSGRRMARLVDDVLDFARGRLGGGITLELVVISALELTTTFEEVIEEIQVANPSRDVVKRIALARPVRGDRVRLGQLLSNLLANAVAHGSPSSRIEVTAEDRDGALVIEVGNQGSPISGRARAHLFEPFERGLETQSRTGLGLGLYIASEIVRSHGGTISVTSTEEAGTTFCCTVPHA